VNEAYQGEDSRPRSDEEMEEDDILNSIEDFADYGSGKTFLSVDLKLFFSVSPIEQMSGQMFVSNCACEINRL
jgi:hypothetical protein